MALLPRSKLVARRGVLIANPVMSRGSASSVRHRARLNGIRLVVQRTGQIAVTQGVPRVSHGSFGFFKAATRRFSGFATRIGDLATQRIEHVAQRFLAFRQLSGSRRTRLPILALLLTTLALLTLLALLLTVLSLLALTALALLSLLLTLPALLPLLLTLLI